MHHGNNPPQKPNSPGSKVTDFNYWLVTIEAFLLTLFVYYFTRQRQDGHRQHQSFDYEEDEDGICLYDDDNGGFFGDFYDNLLTSVRVVAGAGVVGTFALNGILGRRPSNDHHHDPFYHRIVQGAGHIMPTVLAMGHSILSFAGKAVFGSRAEAAEHLISEVVAVANIGQRVGTIADRLYDHAMDRSTESDGNVRRVEYIAIRVENGIVYVVELVVNAAYVAMDSGVTRFTVNDQNRLYVIAGIFHAADIVEAALIFPINEYTYYATRIADLPVVSNILRYLRIADPERPIKAVEPKKIDKVDEELKEFVHDAVGAVSGALHDMVDGVKHLIHTLPQAPSDASSDTQEAALFVGDPHEESIIVEQIDGHYHISFPEGLTTYQYNFPSYLPHGFSISIPANLPVTSHFELLLPNGYSINFVIVANCHKGGIFGRAKGNDKKIIDGVFKTYKLDDCLRLGFKKAIAQKEHGAHSNFLEGRVSKGQGFRVKNHEKPKNKDDGDRKMTPEELEEYEREQKSGSEGSASSNHKGVLERIAGAVRDEPEHPLIATYTHPDATHSLDLSHVPANSIFHLSSSNLPENLTFFIPTNAERGFSLDVDLAGVAHLHVNVVDHAHAHNPGVIEAMREDETGIGYKMHSYLIDGGVLITFDLPIIGSTNKIELFIEFLK